MCAEGICFSNELVVDVILGVDSGRFRRNSSHSNDSESLSALKSNMGDREILIFSVIDYL